MRAAEDRLRWVERETRPEPQHQPEGDADAITMPRPAADRQSPQADREAAR